MLFVGAAAMLEPEHATVEAAPMSAAPKKSPLLQIVFHVVRLAIACCSGSRQEARVSKSGHCTAYESFKC